MPDWTHEFSPDYEVPKFIQFLVSKKVFEDTSWHNDAMPSFGIFNKNGDDGVQLWVDHPLMSRREMGTKRFAVTSNKAGEQENKAFETDDLEEALSHLFQKLAKLKGTMPPLVFAWWPSDSLVKRPWEDPSEHLDELKDEYLKTFRR